MKDFWTGRYLTFQIQQWHLHGLRGKLAISKKPYICKSARDSFLISSTRHVVTEESSVQNDLENFCFLLY